MVTRALLEPVRRHGLRCDHFVAIIDGMQMDTRTDIRAPSLFARGWERLYEPVRIPAWRKVVLLLSHGLTGR
jgi:hypothetical protein